VQHPHHLGQGGRRVVDEHEGELAAHRVMTVVAERQRLGPALDPIDRLGLATRDREHFEVRIAPGD